MVAAAVIGFVYSLFQLPFALYYAIKGKRAFHGRFLGLLDFFVDKVYYIYVEGIIK